jgi:hypothetical protein
MIDLPVYVPSPEIKPILLVRMITPIMISSKALIICMILEYRLMRFTSGINEPKAAPIIRNGSPSPSE